MKLTSDILHLMRGPMFENPRLGQLHVLRNLNRQTILFAEHKAVQDYISVQVNESGGSEREWEFTMN